MIMSLISCSFRERGFRCLHKTMNLSEKAFIWKITVVKYKTSSLKVAYPCSLDFKSIITNSCSQRTANAIGSPKKEKIFLSTQ